MQFRIMASRHSAFYTPLLTCITGLRQQGHDVEYRVLQPGQRGYALLRDGEVDVMQSAVSSSWALLELNTQPVPVHFAQINCRDGFFVVGRRPEPDFRWKTLEGKTLLADHGAQPLVMLQYAVKYNGVDWDRINVVDAGAPAEMESAFRGGAGDYVHLQAPIAVGEIVTSVGASMPPVAFSSLCCSRAYQRTDAYRTFLHAYAEAREWSLTAPAGEVADCEASFFPEISSGLLAETVARYQRLGTWDGAIEIPHDLYEQALTVFQSAGAISHRYPYDLVVA
jgi:NitT/TauT family transport system substrate-binding protein